MARIHAFYTGTCLIAFSAFLLAACGGETTENITNINQMGMEVASSVGDLPKCTADNEGEPAWVKGESFVRICSDGEWLALSGESSNSDFSCKTEELKDSSGIKIVCNGDSIGVVLNGAKGEAGKDGKDGEDGTDGKDGEDGKDAVLPNDTLEADSERVAISLDSLVGYTQKGPFLKGSTVYLHELSDGRTLKQTNGNFTSNIARDDGRYKFNARDLVSQYAMVVVDGYYRNEVTGVSSNASIRLKAITDMRKHSSVNVNILTYLEFERVYHLVTRDHKTVKAAKRQAQKEILNLFHIGLDKETDAEDMDVFGDSDADAALLAISILLQGNRTESELMALLSEISNAIVENGKWEGDRADTIRAQMADWVFGQNLPQIRKNVEGWGLNKGGTVGNFERIIENFIAGVYGVESCVAADDGWNNEIDNKLSVFYGLKFLCVGGMLVEKYNTYYNANAEYGWMRDPRNRRGYRTVTVGDQVWMAENLDYEYKVKPNGQDHNETYGNVCGADQCKGGNGRYYTWAAAMDSAAIFTENGRGCGYGKKCSPVYPVRGICPEGWHLPSKTEWETLFDEVGGQSTAGEVLKSTYGWTYDANGGNCTDSIGFSALPAGGAHNMDGTLMFSAGGFSADFWSSNEKDAEHIYFVTLSNSNVDAYLGYNYVKSSGYSVRCVKD